MKFIQGLALISTIVACATSTTVYVQQKGIINTCTSEYHTDIELTNMKLIGDINFVSSTSRTHQYFTNVSGRVEVNGNKYYINREQVWDYTLQDRLSGIMKIYFSRENVNASDTVQGTEVDGYIMGKEPEGRNIRIWRIDDDILLTGNAYAPRYACVKMR